MINRPICPVILAGGTGTRLWPVSRAARPKQFARLAESETLIAETVRRFEDAGCGPPIFVTQDAYRWAVQAEAQALGLIDHRIVLEPEARGTAAAIAAVAEIVAAETPDALILITPSDQLVSDTLTIAEAVAHGAEMARHGDIVVFGIVPNSPETGFGYIETPEPVSSVEVQRFVRFLEKPNKGRAEELVSSGRFFWNAGIFLATARTFQQLMRDFAPKVSEAASAGVATATRDLGFLRLGDAYSLASIHSFDTAVMEKTEGWVVPLNAGWSDLGTWRGVWEASAHDEANCVTLGAARAFDCENSFLLSSEADIELVGIGLKNVAAVATRDAVLVVDMDHGQSVSEAVERLGSEGVKQAETFNSDHRPWGYYEVLARGPRYQVKSIVVHPGGTLSLQSHEHRSEHWVVVQGTASVSVKGETRLVTENQSVYIPVGAKHRLANEGRQPLRLIEVQTGTYLEEDDIVRYDDVYART